MAGGGVRGHFVLGTEHSFQEALVMEFKPRNGEFNLGCVNERTINRRGGSERLSEGKEHEKES